jgi:nucleoside-diphosphate-sugar epimerase
METSRVAVTGAGGFVGKALVRALGQSMDQPNNLLAIHQGRGYSQSGVLEEIGFENEELTDRLKDVKIFIHTAGKSKGTPEELLQANVLALKRYIEMLPASLEHVIHFSSLNVLFPRLSPYAETKLKGEQLWAASPFARQVTVLRPALIYGPGDRRNIGRLIGLVNRFPMIPVPACGSMRPVYLNDMLGLVMIFIGQNAVYGKTLVVSGQEETSLRDLIQRLARQMNCRRVCIPLPDWFLKIFTRAARICGLKGLAQAVDGYRLERPWHDPAVWGYLGRPATRLEDGLHQCVAYHQDLRS